MNNFVVGVDPDSEAHGIAIYANSVLIELHCWTLIELWEWITLHNDAKTKTAFFAIENVLSNKFIYARNDNVRKNITNSIAMKVGRVQQAQLELQRVLDYCNVPYMLINPHCGNWANNREQFKKLTGWNGKSNADTRSAAYFGFLYIDEKKRNREK